MPYRACTTSIGMRSRFIEVQPTVLHRAHGAQVAVHGEAAEVELGHHHRFALGLGIGQHAVRVRGEMALGGGLARRRATGRLRRAPAGGKETLRKASSSALYATRLKYNPEQFSLAPIGCVTVCRHRCIPCVVLAFFACWCAGALQGGVVRYKLEGTLQDAAPFPLDNTFFGRDYSADTPYIATLAYDPSVASIDPVPDDDEQTNTYRMDIPRGLRLLIEGDVLHLDSYFVEVANDREEEGEVDDTIIFNMHYDPATDIPIYFNGVAYSQGQISINLVNDDPATLHSAALPDTLPDSFAAASGSLIGDDSAFVGDVDHLLTTPTAGFSQLTPGDYDGDGVVTAADYGTWRDDYTPQNLRSDGNFDNAVNAADYTMWRDHLPRPSPGAGATAPEPRTAFGIFLAWMGCLATRRRT